MLDNFSGREEECQTLRVRLKSKKSEFIAVYGRRRVGKTHLIRHVIAESQMRYIEVTGLKDGNLKSQLEVFLRALAKTFRLPYKIASPTKWIEAFDLLTHLIDTEVGSAPFVIFLDELPWLASPKSELLQMIDHFWNSDWVKRPNIKFIICGSAASWIIDNVINAKGGLHNRLTLTILLEPFLLKDTKEFLANRSIKMHHFRLLELYLVMGGVPFYLEAVEKGLSAVQNIDQMCFTQTGILNKEFNRLYGSLFKNAEIYEEIVREIAKKPQGIGLKELGKKLSHSSLGGTLTKRLHELEAAGFVSSFIPYGRSRKGVYFRLIDEYSLFYLKWIEPVFNRAKVVAPGYWQSQFKTAEWKSWSGYAFEAICYKHVNQIAKALKIQSGFTVAAWRYIPQNKEEHGVQIDLLFDRDDGVINLIEVKFSEKPFRITKEYANKLGRKIDVFREQIKTNKDLSLVMVAASGLLENDYSEELVSNTVTLDDLFG